MWRILFLCPILCVAGCGGGGGGGSSPPPPPPPPPTKYVLGEAMIAPKALHPMMMVAEVITPGDEAELRGLTYCQVAPTAGDDTTYYSSAFKLALPSIPVVGTKYHLVVFNDKDGDGAYDIGSDTIVPEFLGDWSYYLVYDGTKWSVVDPFDSVPAWGTDATSTGSNIVVESKYLE